jgi:protein-disulfide isomerase
MSRLRTMIGPNDHALGPRDAPVTIVEYGDYECPFCGRAHPEVKRLLAMAGDRMRYAYRHFPLTQIHPHALQAAEAAEAAGAQGRFWEMHDMLFANQDALELPDLLTYAETIGLDMEAFERDLAEHRFLERVRSDFMGGVRSGVNGTPTFFVNGERHEGAATAEGLLAAIEGGPGTYRY